jgi:hypothetical protein
MEKLPLPVSVRPHNVGAGWEWGMAMHLVMRVWIGLFSLLGIAAPAFADSFGDWEFSPPEGYEHEVTRNGMTYQGPGGVFLFTESQPASGQPLAKIAPQVVEEATGIAPSDQRFISDFSAEDGLEASAYIATDNQALYIVAVFKRDDTFGAAIFITNQSEIEAEQQALIETIFTPSADAEKKPAATPVVAAWPAPLTSNQATTRPRLSVMQAETMRLDPEHMPIPGEFGCFIIGNPRPMTPTPDVTLTFSPAFSYTITDGKTNGSGRWWMEPDDTFDQVVKLDGTLEHESYIVVSAGQNGQVIRIDNPFVTHEEELLCLQAGPAVEREQQIMARVAMSSGYMACTDRDEKAFQLVFGNGIYSVPEGRGYLETSIESYSGDSWDGVFHFTSGPLSLYGGKLSADASGAVKLELSTEWTTGSIFYSSSETTIHAICTAKLEPRPLPIYGMDPPPPATAPEGGLPEGLYSSFEGRYVYSGTFSNYTYFNILTYVAPGGRQLSDVDLDEIGDLPDCSKSRPDGHAFCGEYRIKGNTIQRRDEGETKDEDWDEAEPFTLTDTGFEIDGITYTRLEPLATDALIGNWVADSFTGSSSGVGATVGQYTDADVYWAFSADNRFEWAESSTTQTLIVPDPFLGGASGGGSSSSQDGGSGSYSFDGLWLTLTFDDGRVKRLSVLGSKNEDGSYSLEIQGNSLKKA